MKGLLLPAFLLALAAGMPLLAGCVPFANEEMTKLNVGMGFNQVEDILGKPEAVKEVRFKGQSQSFLVWEYEMIPPEVACPASALGRALAATATLGVSEVARHQMSAEAHWVYFLDGQLVYTSRAMDCGKNYPDCTVWPVPIAKVVPK